jgi:hypothetical protein
MIAALVQDVTRYRTPLLIAGAGTAAALLTLLARRLVRRMPPGTPWFYYLASAGGLTVSLNTSWRFFGQRLGITGAERVVMFSVVELALIACAVGMRANVRHVDPASGRPGPAGAPRTVAWVLCGLSGYAALLLSGPVDGIARVALGPVLSLVMMHMALGIEIRNRTAVWTGTWARIGVEIRERVLSRLGLANDERTALTRTHERAARRVARLAIATRTPWHATRLSRALRASCVAHDPVMRERMLAELAVLRHASALATLPVLSPWTPERSASSSVSTATSSMSGAVRSASAPVSAVASNASTTGEQDEHSMLAPLVSEDTFANGVLDGVVLAADADDTDRPWPLESSKNAAIDRADALLPGRSPRALATALGQVGVTVAESSIRRRRAHRPRPTERLLTGERIGERREHAEHSAR